MDAGRYDRAEASAKTLVQSVAGSQEPAVKLDAIDLLVEALWRNGRADAATRALAERAATERESVKSLGNFAQVLLLAGKHEQAIQITERTLQHVETNPTDPAALADALDDFASALLQQQVRYEDSRKAIDRSLQIRELTPDIALARTLELSGLWLLHRADYARSKPVLERALILRESGASDHPALVRTLGLLGDQLWFAGSVLEAAELYRRAVALAERTLRKDHPDTAVALRNLATTELELGSISRAVAMQARALEICEANFGPEHPMVALSLNDLAVGYMAQQDFLRARSAFQRSVRVAERVGAPDLDGLATTSFNLAFLAGELGDLPEAKLQTARAVAIWEKRLGRKHPFVARAWHRLGETLLQHHRTSEALPILQRSLSLREQGLGVDHVDVARTLLQLAIGSMQQGRLKDAEALSGRAVAIWERHSPDTTGHGTALFVRAETAAAARNFEEARRSYERAVTIRNRIYGPLHLDVARAQQGYAKVLVQSDDRASAFTTALEAETAARATLRTTIRYLPERQAIEYSQLPPAGLHVALSVLDAATDPVSSGRALDALVLGRGVILEEMAGRNRAAVYSHEPGLAALWEEVAVARQRLANLAVRTPSDRRPGHYMTLVDAARRDKEAAERALAEKSTEFKRELERGEIDLRRVREALTARSAIISIVRYERTVGAQTKTVPHYASFVLVAGRNEPAVVQLGPAAMIDHAIARWRREGGVGLMNAGSITAAEATYRTAGDRLRRLVWDPLAHHLVDIERVFVVADGSLNLVNLGALPVGASEYLVERRPTIHYLSTERDLVQASEAKPAGTGLLALGGPTFDAAPSIQSRQRSTLRDAPCGTLQSMMFQELPATLREATEIAGLWKSAAASAGTGDVQLSVASQATERAFKQRAPGRRVLHLATHGFFLGGECHTTGPGTRAVGRISAARTTPPRPEIQNPLLLSGLAFAGANQRAKAKPDEDDGILTAEEISAMNLQGTEWAVLSACDTGLGEVKAGEGVFGLRRAFQIAGVRTVIMSLWSVEDEATRQWMRALYDARLTQRLDTAESVRAASLHVLRDRRAKRLSTHPFYWGAFVSAGDWR